MNLYASSPESLWSSPSFVRFTACSVAAHATALFLVMYGPIFRSRSAMLPQPVMIDLQMAAAPAEPAPPEPAPPEPPPPEPPAVKPPEPEPPPPEPEPEPPKQVVQEAMVVPDVPAEKPRTPKPKPKEPVKKPTPKPKDVADVMSELRKNVEQRNPAPKPSSGAPGTVDAEMAAYMRMVEACVYQNWVGAQRFQRRRDLSVDFEVELAPGGKAKSVEITRSSGEDSLDDSAERAILKCQPFPEPPGGRTTIPITFVPGEKE